MVGYGMARPSEDFEYDVVLLNVTEASPDQDNAVQTWRHVADHLRARCPKVGIFPNEDSIARLIGAAPLEANDEWQLLSRNMQVESMAELNPPKIEETTSNCTQSRLIITARSYARNYATLTDPLISSLAGCSKCAGRASP